MILGLCDGLSNGAFQRRGCLEVSQIIVASWSETSLRRHSLDVGCLHFNEDTGVVAAVGSTVANSYAG